MITKQSADKKTEIKIEVTLAINYIGRLKEVIEEVSNIEKEYNCNCTQVQVNIV